MLTRNETSKHPCFVPWAGEVQYFTIKHIYWFLVDGLVDALYQIKEGFFFSYLVGFLNKMLTLAFNNEWILSNVLSVSSEIILFLSFILLI